MARKKSFRFSIRSKLLLLSALFLLVPYTAYRSLLQLESSLRDGLESSLLDVGQSIAAFLGNRDDLLRQGINDVEQYLFVHDLKYPVLLDGYIKEWQELIPWSNTFASKDSEFNYRLVMGKYSGSLFIMLSVTDPKLLFHDPTQKPLFNSDQVSLFLKQTGSETLRLELAPEAPGKLFPFRVEEYWLREQDKGLIDPETRKIFITNITAFWQVTDDGYSVEIEIPDHLIPEKFGLEVRNMTQYGVSESIMTSDTSPPTDRLIEQSKELNSILKSMGVTKNRRIWVLDNLGQVVAVDGSLKSLDKKPPVNLLYEILLPKTYVRFEDDISEASRLVGSEVESALYGDSDIRWRSADQDKIVILSAAVPIKKNDQVLGAVVVEETTNGIQLLKRNALTSLLNQTLLVFFIITILILIFASYLSWRLRQLSQQTNHAIDEYGRVVGEINIPESADELGDLSHNFKQILKRLGQYHEYLEGMGGKLSHELRTPLAVVQSSLENLEQDSHSESAQVYIQRARDGVSQLNHLLLRLSEAARIEQAIQTAEFEHIDLVSLLENCIQAYKDVYPDTGFVFTTDTQTLELRLAPDLIIQMLDKVVSNAIDFHTPGTSIEFSLARQNEEVVLEVINEGPLMPVERSENLFNSMITDRPDDNSKEPHLGLGLYIARLICEFHSGRIEAINLTQKPGVSLRMVVPVTVPNF